MKKIKSVLLSLTAFTSISHASNNLLSLSMEELSDIRVDDTSVTLTSTALKNVPATITTITHQDILESGARNLDELLEIYVPSFNYMYKVHGSQMGFRGIISDRNNKVLLLLNGRVMNIKAKDGGAVTERWFSTLADIKNVKVITGPGSAIYGAGAIAGVISIETFSGRLNRGIEISTKGGLGEKFINTEISYSTKLKNNLYLYTYYGLDKYDGASYKDAPMKFAFDYSGHYSWNNNIDAPADKRYDHDTTNDNSALDGELRHKFHFQLSNNNFTFWTRFTQSSLSNPTEQHIFQWLGDNNAYKYKNTGSKNRQITAFTEYRQKVNKNLKFTYDLSYLRSDVYIKYFNLPNKGMDKFWGEDNVMGKILSTYEFSQYNKLAFGAEYNYNWFGRPSDVSSENYSQFNARNKNTKFESDLISFFGEYQSKIYDNFTLFVGGRADKHKYTPWMYSPRVDFIYNANEKDIFKLGFNRSVRSSDDFELYTHYKDTHDYGDVEKLNTIEFIYEKYAKNSFIHIGLFYNNHDIVAYNDITGKTEELGDANSWGTEIELQYKNGKNEFYISHSYTKLLSFTLEDKTTSRQNVSASPYGYGDDFANWHNHITKLRYNYKISNKLKWVNSLRIFWGMNGAKDMAEYNNNLDQNTTHNNDPKYRLPLYDSGHTRAFEESVYLNTSLLWNINKQTLFSINGYNLLGLLDEDYNKRNFFKTTSQYRDSAPSIAIGLKYKF